MKLILLSGGSGKRLWPMSNDSRSKQFLKVLKGEDEVAVSMLQRVWKQLAQVGLQEHAHVCASKAQRDMILSQVGDVAFIEEPARRDTFPAISYACTYLADVKGCSDDEVVVVLPVDHFVEDEYFVQVAGLEQVLDKSGADLALLGVHPTEPTSKFGYIRVAPEGAAGDWFQVNAFVEKPDRLFAEKLIAEGALWNCGVFCFRVGYVRNVLRNLHMPTSFQQMHDEFLALPKISFDYEVVEKAKSVVACSYAGGWKDLGTWGSLSEEMSTSFVGEGESADSQNTHVINELGIPVVTLGIENAMVVATPDGILVADKQASAQLKEVVGNYDGRPMYEERRWGQYKVLDYQKLDDGNEVLTKCIELLPGHNISYQKHFKRSEVWTIIEGAGEMALDNRIFPVSTGDVVRIYAEQWHAIRAKSKLKFIEVQRGSELIEEDIVRRYMTWHEVQQHCSTGLQSFHSTMEL
jgi:mannose-1-phosphate guanylyltransferase